MTPSLRNPYFDSGSALLLKRITEKTIMIQNILFLKISEPRKSTTLKMRVPKILEIRLIRSWKSWIWDRYLQKHEMGIWYFPPRLKELKHLEFIFDVQSKTPAHSHSHPCISPLHIVGINIWTFGKQKHGHPKS